jgi:hypothetical protein
MGKADGTLADEVAASVLGTDVAGLAVSFTGSVRPVPAEVGRRSTVVKSPLLPARSTIWR